MSGSVENNNGHIAGSQSAAFPVSNAVDTESAEGVAIGYSSASSSEVVEAVPASETEDANLDQPKVSAFSLSETESLEVLSSNQQLAGLKEVVSYFNDRFDIDALDMADTASILLFIKGMVSDMRALSNAENVDSALSELLTQYNEHIAIAKSMAEKVHEAVNKKDEKEEDEIERDGNNAELAVKEQALAAKKTTLANKQDELTAEGLTESEIAALEAEIETLNQDIATLDTQIGSLESNISVLETNIYNLGIDINNLVEDVSKLGFRLQAELTSSIERLFSINEGNRERYDRSAVKTGEEQRAAVATINVDDDQKNVERGQLFRTEKEALYKKGNEQVEHQIQREKEIETSRFLSQVLSDAGIDEPENIVALLDTIDVDEVKPLSGNKDLLSSNKNQLLETARVLEAIVKSIDDKKVPDKTLDMRPERTGAEPDHQELLDRASPMSDKSKPVDSTSSAQQNESKVNNVAVSQVPVFVEPEALDVKPDQEQERPVEEQVLNEPATIKPPILTLDSMAEMLRKMESRKLESEALSLVIETEKERLEMEQAISKNTPV